MSFTTNIAGNAPANTFVYTTTTVSVDNISVENLSATNATISVLKTDLFNPVNVAATNINCTTLTVTDDGNFSEIYTHYIHTSNMSLDGVLGGNTGNFATINADNAAFDSLYLNEQSSVLTDKSLIRRDANEVLFIGKNISTDTNGVDYIFRTGEETDAVKLRIPRTSDIVEMIALDVDTTINCGGAGTFAELVAADLTISDTTTLNELEVQTSASIANLNVIGANGLTATKGRIINFSSTNASITNLSVTGGMNAAGTSRFNFLTVDYFQSYLTAQFEALTSNSGNISSFLSYNISNDSGIKTTNLSAVNASISNDLRVGRNINCDRLDAVTVIVAPEVTAPTINATTLLNASTIMAKLVNTSNLSAINASVDNALNVRFAVTCGSVNASTSVTAPIINGNISNNLAAGAGINLSTVGGVTTITNTGLVTSPLSVSVINASTISTIKINVSNISASGTVLAKTLTGNIGGNLVAGAGINLSTNIGTGITTISNIALVSDPLNLSTLNASTINVSLLNADNIEGFTKSTEYAFQATSTQGNNQTINVGTVLNFNQVETETPPPVYVSGFVSEGYDTVLKQYLIPVSGYYQFGFKAFIQDTSDTEFRIAMYQSGVMVGQGGRRAAMTEDFTIVLNCVKGQWISLKGLVGSGSVYMGATHSWFWGHKLTPANNLITSTTNLSIQNLSVADDMSATNAFITNLRPTNFIMPNVTDTFNVSGICNFSNLIRCGVLQGLNISAPIIRAPNMYTSNISATTLDQCLTANISFVNASNVSSITINTSQINGRVGDFAIAVIANEITGSHFYGNNISMTQSITCSNFNASNTVTANKLNVSNISANAVTINSLTAYTNESEFVYFINNAFGAPGTADAQPAIVFKNGPVFEIRSGSPAFPGNINFTRDGTITNMIYDGNLNISSKANISNISATNLTLSTALTGAANINITGDVSAGIVNATTLTGDIGGNLLASTGIDVTTAAGVTTITNTLPYVELGYLSLSRTSNYAPGAVLFNYVSYNTAVDNGSADLTYSFGPNYEIQINTTGRYIISGSGSIDNTGYNGRIALRIRLTVNGNYLNNYPQAYGYARLPTEVPEATATYTDFVIDLTAGDIVQNRLDITKGAGVAWVSDFSSVSIASGSNCMIRRIS